MHPPVAYIFLGLEKDQKIKNSTINRLPMATQTSDTSKVYYANTGSNQTYEVFSV
jgi:hypothetical protein